MRLRWRLEFFVSVESCSERCWSEVELVPVQNKIYTWRCAFRSTGHKVGKACDILTSFLFNNRFVDSALESPFVVNPNSFPEVLVLLNCLAYVWLTYYLRNCGVTSNSHYPTICKSWWEYNLLIDLVGRMLSVASNATSLILLILLIWSYGADLKSPTISLYQRSQRLIRIHLHPRASGLPSKRELLAHWFQQIHDIELAAFRSHLWYWWKQSEKGGKMWLRAWGIVQILMSS